MNLPAHDEPVCPAGGERRGRHRWVIVPGRWTCLDCGYAREPRPPQAPSRQISLAAARYARKAGAEASADGLDVG